MTASAFTPTLATAGEAQLSQSLTVRQVGKCESERMKNNNNNKKDSCKLPSISCAKRQHRQRRAEVFKKLQIVAVTPTVGGVACSVCAAEPRTQAARLLLSVYEAPSLFCFFAFFLAYREFAVKSEGVSG